MPMLARCDGLILFGVDLVSIGLQILDMAADVYGHDGYLGSHSRSSQLSSSTALPACPPMLLMGMRTSSEKALDQGSWD